MWLHTVWAYISFLQCLSGHYFEYIMQFERITLYGPCGPYLNCCHKHGSTHLYRMTFYVVTAFCFKTLFKTRCPTLFQHDNVAVSLYMVCQGWSGSTWLAYTKPFCQCHWTPLGLTWTPTAPQASSPISALFNLLSCGWGDKFPQPCSKIKWKALSDEWRWKNLELFWVS